MAPFLATDDSVLAALYDQLAINWIFYLPLTLLFKLILVVPPIFFEPDSIEQMTGVALAEISYALFVCVTTPYMSPWVDLLNRMSSSHQLLILALQALNAVALKEGKDPGYSTGMAFVTSMYVFFTLCMFINLMVWPFIKSKLDERAMAKKLSKYGLASSKLAPVFLHPTDPIRRQELSIEEQRLVGARLYDSASDADEDVFGNHEPAAYPPKFKPASADCVDGKVSR